LAKATSAHATGRRPRFCARVWSSAVGSDGTALRISDTWQLVINTSTTIVTFLMRLPDSEHA